MGIEKMTFIDINGRTDCLDDVLIACIRSGVFQPEYAAKLSEYSVGSTALLRNPYGALIIKVGEIASQLKITLGYSDDKPLGSTSSDRDEFIRHTDEYLNEMRREYPKYFQKQNKIGDEIASYQAALDMLAHLVAPDIDFDRLWENKFLKIRFGRLPTQNIAKLSVYEDKAYELYKLDENPNYTWCLYVTAGEYRDDIDKMFYSLGFERLRVPDFVHGTATDAISFIKHSLESERKQLEESSAVIDDYVTREKDKFLMVYTRVKFLHDAYDLRKYAVSIRDHFHIVGFVQKKDSKHFMSGLADIPGIVVKPEPAGADSRIPVPVRLRNNWFVRPFEMFVTMYGFPSYGDIDPSPFVAYTYSILFGIMFGDMGHGMCVALIGFLAWKLKGMALGRILTRVGISSMFFGFWYGSVFGFEHLLDPVFALMGFHEKPIEVMHPDTTNKILIAAIGLGAAIILMSIMFNMLVGIKHRNYDRLLLSSNGLCGFVFYLAVLFAAVMMVAGWNVLNPVYITCFIVLPLVFIFFREPIVRYAGYRSKDSAIHHDADLNESNLLEHHDANIPELFGSPFMTARFGRIPTDSYKKLNFYANEPFMLYPIKTDPEYIWLIYATAIPNKAQIDAIFHDLYFERVYIPDEDMNSTEEAEAFIKKCVEAGGTPEDAQHDPKYGAAEIKKPKTLYQRIFPDGFGAFFTETFFEMFEVLLSFITNTMSFLRVGGFILVHAGMMSVVFTLASMVNAGGTVVIIIIGNIFVMALEGLIVGIQVLRLEFYEMFSRFYDANGEPFTPVSVSYANPGQG